MMDLIVPLTNISAREQCTDAFVRHARMFWPERWARLGLVNVLWDAQTGEVVVDVRGDPIEAERAIQAALRRMQEDPGILARPRILM